jgi:hypothetical protein
MFTYTICFEIVRDGRVEDRSIIVSSENARDMVVRYCNRHNYSLTITVN